jgi:hypothetical protein
MQSKETGDIVGLIHRVRKKYYHYKACRPPRAPFRRLTLIRRGPWQVALAEFEDSIRKQAADAREAADPTLSDDMSRKTPGAGTTAKPKKKAQVGPARIQASRATLHRQMR